MARFRRKFRAKRNYRRSRRRSGVRWPKVRKYITIRRRGGSIL